MDEPVLKLDTPVGDVRAIALVLHGGREKSTMATRSTQLAVIRMLPFASALRRAGAGSGLAVARLRYRVRGWNGADRSPVRDVEWALDRLAERFPGAPVALVGHSMGGRAALYAGGHRAVEVVVGLAPWIEAGDPQAQLAGRRILFLHGDLDRMTSPDASEAFARRVRPIAASVNYVTVHGERHAMLRRASMWHELSTAYVLATLCARPPGETVGDAAANVVTKALAGEPSLTV